MSRIVVDIRNSGYTLVPDALPASSSFGDAYRAFDAVAQLVTNDELAAIDLEQTSIDWTKDLLRSGFLARAPMGFRDRSIRSDKERKSYFQFSSGYSVFVRENFPRLFSTYPEIEWLFRTCEVLNDASVPVLRSIILEFDKQFSGLQRLLIRDSRFSPVVIRLIRYEPGPQIESKPHHDKSAFTLHMHSDDSKADQFVIGPWRRELLLSDLRPIKSRATLGRNRDAVVFPGMFLSQMGYGEIRPSPHAALGSEERRHRHVAVGFWLIPFMITDHLKTDIPFKLA